MTIIIAQHKTKKDSNGNPLKQEFEEIQWITMWQQSGEWTMIGKKETGTEQETIQPKPITIKKGCGRCGTKK